MTPTAEQLATHELELAVDDLLAAVDRMHGRVSLSFNVTAALDRLRALRARHGELDPDDEWRE